VNGVGWKRRGNNAMNTEKRVRKPVRGTTGWPEAEPVRLEFFLLSYAPHALREESIPFAVVAAWDDSADVQVVNNWQRIVALDPEADIELLTALACEIRDKVRAMDQREKMVLLMKDSWSNAIRLTPGKGYLTINPEAAVKALVSQYLL
jgi:hypothetical protein